MNVIEANHYRETRERLAADPVIQAMAAELPESMARQLVADQAEHGGVPTYELMIASLREYNDRCAAEGEHRAVPTHIGGPAEAILIVLRARVA